jgi:hypothetical protein
MKTQKRQCKCLHCKEHFLPDYRHRERQRFCFKADCRKARKRAIQKAWLEKPGNEKYFRDEENAEAGSGVAKGPSRLLEKHHPVAQAYLTRRVLGASPS